MKENQLRASTITHARIHDFPFARYFQHGRLDDLRQEKRNGGLDLVIDLGALRLSSPPILIEHQGQPAEWVRGAFHPRRLRFSRLAWIQQDGLYLRLGSVPADHPCRVLQGMLAWSPAAKEPIFLMAKRAFEAARLMFSTQTFAEEPRHGPLNQVELIRQWSPPPPMRPGLGPTHPSSGAGSAGIRSASKPAGGCTGKSSLSAACRSKTPTGQWSTRSSTWVRSPAAGWLTERKLQTLPTAGR
jgi:hypothetical protein